ncbi:hypothetical protein TNCV_4550701 [Trichonephila clavipes]|nr:hypothetical protein TNCV_4550701 [Trichonephila clavipes]
MVMSLWSVFYFSRIIDPNHNAPEDTSCVKIKAQTQVAKKERRRAIGRNAAETKHEKKRKVPKRSKLGNKRLHFVAPPLCVGAADVSPYRLSARVLTKEPRLISLLSGGNGASESSPLDGRADATGVINVSDAHFIILMQSAFRVTHSGAFLTTNRWDTWFESTTEEVH